ncbi:hypothetical protein N0V85_007456, partial [Neurospora sp. IMI 360204]
MPLQTKTKFVKGHALGTHSPGRPFTGTPSWDDAVEPGSRKRKASEAFQAELDSLKTQLAQVKAEQKATAREAKIASGRSRQMVHVLALKFIRNIPEEARDPIQYQTNINAAINKALRIDNALNNDPINEVSHKMFIEAWKALT